MKFLRSSRTGLAVRCTALLALSLSLAPCDAQAFWKRKPKAPEWVTDPDSVEQTYPKSRYFVGFGVCGGAGERDVMSRKQAESTAISDIVSYVEIKINDVIEQHDTTVMRNRKEQVQSVTHQRTRREVTGMLSGVEIKEVFFDKRAMNWHAMAVLERARAGRGALEAIDQRLKRGEKVLAADRTALHDYLELRAVNATLDELDRLAIAIALFAPRRSDAVEAKTDDFKLRLAERLAATGQKVAIRVAVSGAIGLDSGELQRSVERILRDNGFNISSKPGKQFLEISIMSQAETQHGSVKLVSVRTGGRYVFRDSDRELMSGMIEPGLITVSRADSLQKAEARSLAKFMDHLGKVLGADLQERYRRPLD